MKKKVSLNLISLLLITGVGTTEAYARKLLTITLTNGEIHNFEPEKSEISFVNNKNLVIKEIASPDTITFPIDLIGNMFFTNVTGIEALDKELYKIVVTEQHLIVRSVESGKIALRVISPAGSEVLSKTCDLNEPVNVASLPSGAYLLIINNQYAKFIKP